MTERMGNWLGTSWNQCYLKLIEISTVILPSYLSHWLMWISIGWETWCLQSPTAVQKGTSLEFACLRLWSSPSAVMKSLAVSCPVIVSFGDAFFLIHKEFFVQSFLCCSLYIQIKSWIIIAEELDLIWYKLLVFDSSHKVSYTLSVAVCCVASWRGHFPRWWWQGR